METQAKDCESFNRIYNANKELIFKTAMKYSDNYHVAQEITQNTFLQLYTHFNTYDMDYAVKWLLKSAKNAALNYNKKAAYEIPDENITLTSDLRESAEDTEDVIFKVIHDKEMIRLKEDILSSLYNLNERWFDAVTMVYCLERSQQEVADELGVSIEVLHSVLYRAKKWIKKNYKEQYEATKYL
ncbi:MAG: sigma-70 family RNA polymerase sigma factor [Bariatricus massiliensis]|nr:sigma-70 family RNA polymerase sigma factor [Bariatricus massiliensis]